MGEMINAYGILVRKPEKKSPLKTLRPRETGWEDMDWLHQLRLGTSGWLL
jgi:hypothetical protein